jgi:hypothetical protein
MIAAVNSILGGAGLALLGGRLGRLGSGMAVVVGVAGTLILFGLHLWYGFRPGCTVRDAARAHAGSPPALIRWRGNPLGTSHCVTPYEGGLS